MTRTTRRQMSSIIDIIFTTSKICALDIWVIDEELAILSDYKMIGFHQTNLDKMVRSMETSQ